jgi:syntaxin 16
MFYEVSVMIGEQGSILDRIDFNMEIAVDTSKKGVLELEKAEEHQKNDRSIKCIGILVFIIFVLVCVLISKKI